MIKLSRIKHCIRRNRYEISLHAQKERSTENITIHNIEEALRGGEIIEQYPSDKRGASCLVLGHSQNKPIHIVCSILSNGWLRIITVYIPHRHKWVNPKQRR